MSATIPADRAWTGPGMERFTADREYAPSAPFAPFTDPWLEWSYDGGTAYVTSECGEHGWIVTGPDFITAVFLDETGRFPEWEWHGPTEEAALAWLRFRYGHNDFDQ